MADCVGIWGSFGTIKNLTFRMEKKNPHLRWKEDTRSLIPNDCVIVNLWNFRKSFSYISQQSVSWVKG